jgi:HTH-type transcriptional regulator/antitoxin HigA
MKSTTKTKYINLVERFPLRPICNDKENDKAAEICDELTDRINKLSHAEQDYLEVLTDLIIKYESRWDNEIPDMNPRELIQYVMEQSNLTQTDLIPEFGSASRVSEFLSGKRKLSLQQAKNLSKRFKLKLTALL